MAAEQGEASAQVQPRGHVRQRVGRPRGFLAGANGHEGARESRDTLERDMTRAEISRATKLARTCMDSDYQDCAP